MNEHHEILKNTENTNRIQLTGEGLGMGRAKSSHSQAEEYRRLFSPFRLSMLSLLPMSAKEICGKMGMKSDAIYYHLNIMAKYGLISYNGKTDCWYPNQIELWDNDLSKFILEELNE